MVKVFFLVLSVVFCSLAAHAAEERPEWLELAIQDAQSRALVEAAVGKLGLQNVDELVEFVKSCDDSQAPSFRRGLSNKSVLLVALYATEGELRSGKSPEKYFNARIEAEKERRQAYGASLVEMTPDYAYVKFWVSASICLRENMPILWEYGTFIHELTHLVESDQLADEDLLAYRDLDDYALRKVLAPGSEVDAFIAGSGAQLRISHDLADISPVFRPFFDQNGRFAGTRLALAAVILAPFPQGLGYRERNFRKQYANQLQYELTHERLATTALTKTAKSRLAAGNTVAFARLQEDLRLRAERIRRLEGLARDQMVPGPPGPL